MVTFVVLISVHFAWICGGYLNFYLEKSLQFNLKFPEIGLYKRECNISFNLSLWSIFGCVFGHWFHHDMDLNKFASNNPGQVGAWIVVFKALYLSHKKRPSAANSEGIMEHGQFECSTVNDLGKRCNYMELHAADKKYLWIRSNWLAVPSDKIYPSLVLTPVCLFYSVPFILCFTFMCSLSAVLKEIKWMLNNFLHQGRWPEGAAVHASCLLFTEEKNRIDSFNLVSSLLNFSVAQHKIPQLKIQNYPWNNGDMFRQQKRTKNFVHAKSSVAAWPVRKPNTLLKPSVCSENYVRIFVKESCE